MPLSFRNTKTDLVIAWESEDKSRTATFKVPKQAPEEEQVAAMQRALNYLAMQTGVALTVARTLPHAPEGVSPTTGTTPTIPLTTFDPGPSTAGRIPMMPPASLSDRPSDGGRPGNVEFWESMPTTQLPAMLQSEKAGGWEFIPPEEM